MKSYFICIAMTFAFFNSGHAQWTKITLPSDYTIAQMQFVNDSVGFIIADSIMGLSLTGKVFKTTDRGLTWDEKNLYYGSFNYMHFMNPDTGWVCMNDGTTGTIRRTYDGGNSWFNVGFNAPHGPVYFVSSTEGYIAGFSTGASGVTLAKTINGGVSWTNTGINFGISAIQDVIFTDPITAFAGGLYGPTLGRIDVSSLMFNSFSSSIAVFDLDFDQSNNQLYFTGEEFSVSYGLYKTSPGGSPIDFIADNTLVSILPYSVKCKSANEIICGGSAGSVAFSSDGGLTWIAESTGSQTGFTDVFWGSDYALAAGGDGDLYRRSFPVSTNEMAGEELFLMYPNPANSIINIENKFNADITVSVFNVLQQKVLEKKFVNDNSFSIDLSMLQDAMYIVILTSSRNETIAIKKLLKN